MMEKMLERAIRFVESRIIERFKWQLTVLAVLLGAPLYAYAFYLDGRPDAVENSLRYQSPHVTVNQTSVDLVDLSTKPAQGQVVYIPAYSHVYHDDGKPLLLAITLSVRNTSADHAIVIDSVRYFDTDGKELKSYLAKPVQLPALASTEFLVERDDTAGGSGANFLVEWSAVAEVAAPVIEALMIDATEKRGIAFVRTGIPLRPEAPYKDGAKPPE